MSNYRAIITHNYKCLHHDDADIVFTGLNIDNEIIIGSIIEEDDERKIIKEFRLIVDNITLDNFINRKICYLDVLKRAIDIYIVDISFLDHSAKKPNKITKIDFESIPKDILPLDNSFLIA